MNKRKISPSDVVRKMRRRGAISEYDIMLSKNADTVRYTHSSDLTYDLASILKSIVYTAILIFDSRRILSIEDKVSKYIDITGDFIEELRIKHLMTNTCDFNYEDNFDKKFLLSAGLKYGPGTKVSYRNTQSIVAAWVLESVTGNPGNLEQSLRDVLENYFSPSFSLGTVKDVSKTVVSAIDIGCGVINDPTARLFLERDKMVVGCAGLFGTMHALDNFLDFFFTEEGREIYKKIVQYPVLVSDPVYSLGFIKRSKGYVGDNKFDNGLIMTQGYPGSSIYLNPDFCFKSIILTNHRATPEPKNTNVWFLKNGPGKTREMYFFRRLLLKSFLRA